MIWTLKIELLYGAYAENQWGATLEIDDTSTLEALHAAIQDAVAFDDDHLYEFYISRTDRSRDRIRFDDENEGIYGTTLADLYPLEKGRNLYYMFDYGDNWTFKISKSRKSPQTPIQGITYPRKTEEVGIRPEQYSDWE